MEAHEAAESSCKFSNVGCLIAMDTLSSMSDIMDPFACNQFIGYTKTTVIFHVSCSLCWKGCLALWHWQSAIHSHSLAQIAVFIHFYACIHDCTYTYRWIHPPHHLLPPLNSSRPLHLRLLLLGQQTPFFQMLQRHCCKWIFKYWKI